MRVFPAPFVACIPYWGSRGDGALRVETKATGRRDCEPVEVRACWQTWRGVLKGPTIYIVPARRSSSLGRMKRLLRDPAARDNSFDNLDEIVSVPGVDIAWMGHYDLTVYMGIPAQFDHPNISEGDGRSGCCVQYDMAWRQGSFRPQPESAVHWINKGFRAISLGSDIGVFLDGVRKFP